MTEVIKSEAVQKLETLINELESKLSTYDADCAAKRVKLVNRLEDTKAKLKDELLGKDHRVLDSVIIKVKDAELEGIIQGVTQAAQSADWYKVLTGAGTPEVAIRNVRVAQIVRNVTAEARLVAEGGAVPVAAPAAAPGALPEVPVAVVTEVAQVQTAAPAEVPSAPEVPQLQVPGLPGGFEVPQP